MPTKTAAKLGLMIGLLAALVCPEAKAYPDTRRHLTRRTVIAKAVRAMEEKFPGSTKGHAFTAELQMNGVWEVYVRTGRHPAILGGGAPNAEVRDRDAKVLQIYLSR